MFPHCFILMPFGLKSDEKGRSLNFDEIYHILIKPAIALADLTPIRADEEVVGGIIHKPMFERLMLCDFAVADLTTSNANVFYELGVRHGLKPHSTLLLFAEGTKLPFDVAFMRAIPYKLDKAGKPKDIKATIKLISERLIASKAKIDDSPVFQLINGMPRSDLSHLKTDIFLEQIEYESKLKERLHQSKLAGKSELEKFETSLGDLSNYASGILVDLMLSYRAVGAFDCVVSLVEKFTEPLSGSIMVREQYGMALNRIGRKQEAEQVLSKLIEREGANPETNGILGRVYKDLWQQELNYGNSFIAEGLLEKAIECYLDGFESDWRDFYPGVNALTLMVMKSTVDSRISKFLPLVHYAVEREIQRNPKDYWASATLFEIAIIKGDKSLSKQSLQTALSLVSEPWMAETTLKNISMIYSMKKERNEEVSWMDPFIQALKIKSNNPILKL